jgi:hypothetical protein
MIMRAKDNAEPRYRVRDYTAIPMGLEDELLVMRAPVTQVRCPTYLAGMPAACTRFDHLAGHVAMLSRAFGLDRGGAEHLHAELVRLADAGLLVALETVRERARRAEHTPPPPIDAISIVTRDRAPSFQTCLANLAHPLIEAGRLGALVVADDSRDSLNVDANRQALTRLAASQRLDVRYLSREARGRFADTLASATGAPADLVRFALCGAPAAGVATGAARNACLLQTAGHLGLNVDDDVRCGRHDGPSPSGLVCRSGDPTVFTCYADVSTALAAIRAPSPAYLLASHARLLGRSLSSCLDALAPTADTLNLDGMRSAFFEQLWTDQARVGVTMTGIAGDSGMGRPCYFLLAAGETWARLNASEAEYAWARTTRAVTRMAPTWSIAEATMLQSAAFGLDNRLPGVPFMPLFRNQDGLFATTLRTCMPGICIGHVPMALQHAPPATHRFEDEAIWRATPVMHVADYLIRLTTGCPFGAGDRDSERRRAVLAAHLQALGSLPVPELAEVLRMERLHCLSETIANLEMRLRHETLHADLTADIERALDRLQAATATDTTDCPAELVDDDDAEAGLARFARYLLDYGRLLECWPTLFHAARSLPA